MNMIFADDSVNFHDMDSFVSALLRQLPAAASTDEPKAGDRIFPGLIRGDEAANAEWVEFVEPGLRELFRSHVDVVAEDLGKIATEGELSSVSVPLAHAPAWIHTLNQARLCLGARHDVTEEDMEHPRGAADPERGYALLQIEVYGVILSAFLEGAEF